MTRRGWLLVCSSVLGTTVAGYAFTRRMRKPPPPSQDSAGESELLRLINAERVRLWFKVDPNDKAQPLRPLVQDQKLQEIAAVHAESLAFTRMVEAPGAVNQELLSSGYVFKYVDTISANPHQMTLADAFAGWMNDPNQKKIKGLILNPFYADIGIGVFRKSATDDYYVYILLAKKQAAET